MDVPAENFHAGHDLKKNAKQTDRPAAWFGSLT